MSREIQVWADWRELGALMRMGQLRSTPKDLCGVGVDKAQAMKSVLAGEMLLTYCCPVDDLVLTLPGEALANARIPPAELERELRRRLAAALFSDGIVGGAAACRLAGMDKPEFQHWLGERGISQPLGVSDYGQEHQNLTAWLEED